jgi:ribosomal protein S18 acetylase RimI-like enzyme
VVDGWRLRASPTVRRRRSNSVLAKDLDTPASLEDSLRTAENFYATRGLPTRFQISPLARDLDQVLEADGYRKETETLVQTAAITDAIAPRSALVSDIEIRPEPTDDWLGTWAEVFSLSDAPSQREEILLRIGPPAAYALVREEYRPIAVGLAVAERSWVGLYGCGTVLHARRKGIGAHLVAELLRWAAGIGLANVYLQVEADNVGAQAFYRTLGFSTFYRYHYRVKP